jgi:hypothetical protein
VLSYNLCNARLTPDNDSLFSGQKSLFDKLGIFQAWEQVALVYDISPDMPAKEAKKAILEGCDDIGEKGVGMYTGHGCIRFIRTIARIKNGNRE